MQTYQVLKQRQSVERDGHPQNLGLRVHRALSCLNKSELCNDDDSTCGSLSTPLTRKSLTNGNTMESKDCIGSSWRSSSLVTSESNYTILFGTSIPTRFESSWITNLSSRHMGIIMPVGSPKIAGRANAAKPKSPLTKH